ncbi:hypothetical protein DD894_13285, partial [Staphylococcus pseudintermedius]|uniref:ThiF family adenylyltransferase n=1 Tax=Staphylococcus pseudintermedius TaxID=283734 RepID=UPI000DA078EA
MFTGSCARDTAELSQRRLQQLHVFVIGVGALGSGIAEQLVRSGVGKLTIVDKD